MVGLSDRLATAVVRMRGHRARWVKTSVGRVHVLDIEGRGKLPPVVVLHGFSAAGAHYFPLLFRLRDHVRRVLAPDMPAHGLSDAPSLLEPSILQTGLFQAIDEAVDGPSMMIGNSMGGLASIRYAVHRPDRVRGLFLISPAGGHSPPDELDHLRRTFALESHREALDFVDRLFHQPNRLRHLYALGVRRKFRRPTMQRLLQAMGPEMLSPSHLSSLDMPVRVIWGQSDRILPLSHREFFRAHLPAHAEIEEPYDFGHAPFLDNPDALTDRILDFAATL